MTMTMEMEFWDLWDLWCRLIGLMRTMGPLRDISRVESLVLLKRDK